MRTQLTCCGLLLAFAMAGSALAQVSQGEPAKLDASPGSMPTHLVKVLRTSNKAQTNRYVPKVYDLKNVNPADVLRFIRRVVEIEEGAWYTFAAPDGKSGKIVLILPQYQIASVDRLMKEIDREGLTSSSGQPWRFKQLCHRSVADANFRNAVALYASQEPLLLTDTELNALFLLDSPSAVDKACAALEELDVPTPQVKLEVTLYEIAAQNDGQLGLDYMAWKNGPGRSLFAVGAFAETEKVLSLKGPGMVPVFNTGVGTAGLPGRTFYNVGANAAVLYDVPSAYFDFLVAKGKATISTTATLTVLHQKAANLQTGDSILYYAVQDASGNDLSAANAAGVSYGALAAARGGYRTNCNPVDPASGASTDEPKNRTVVGAAKTRSALMGGTLTAQDTGVYLSVVPSIGTDLIDLAVNFRVINHVGYADNGVPLVSRHTASANVKTASGQEIVLGGVTHETYMNAARKIPILGSIPVLGYLFGGERKQAVKRTLVLVVKPTTIAKEFEPMTERERQLRDECMRCDITEQ